MTYQDDRAELQRMSRDELVARARSLGAQRPELMTRVELGDEILRLQELNQPNLRGARGWLGVARDLLASLIDRGLNLPQAAALVRGETVSSLRAPLRPPVATVTLAEIYAAQGHPQRALAMLRQVLDNEPEHDAARVLYQRLQRDHQQREGGVGRAPGTAEATESTDVDAVVPIVTDAGQTFLYWELSSATLQRMQERQPEGRAVIKLVALTPSWEGAKRTEQQHDAEGARGSVTIEAAGPGAVVRAALGWQSADAFRPFAIGAEVSAAGAAQACWLPARHRGDRLRPARQRALECFRQSALCGGQTPAA